VKATGTFLGGRLFRGAERMSGGRLGEPGSHALAQQFRQADVPMARLKTGTPPRLDGRTIDWSRLGRQNSDADPWTMSLDSSGRVNPQLFCGVARTTDRTHAVIRDAAQESPLFAGAITGRGPRYCPSIEDKVVRFGDRDGHQIFLEPETRDGRLIYPNGLSTSLSLETQAAFIRTICGLEQAAIEIPGYAVEYDHVDPRWLRHDLSSSRWPNLFLAGQINGTTGYEEAAGQGLVAGANAASLVRGDAPLILPRELSYIGIMIDDLTTQGVSEPYRMLTARAEHRLALRADNAEARLGELAINADLLPSNREEALTTRRATKAILAARVAAFGADTDAAIVARLGRSDLLDQVLADRRYAPYVRRQEIEVARSSTLNQLIPPGFHFEGIAGLSTEMVEKLSASGPSTLAQASRVPGVTPAALTALMVAVRRLAA
jgi:tRNA uridine 5-carboxymethylaminomethyl modification enzyme